MAIKDWEITIDRQTKAVSQAGFGTPLILATSKAQDFKTYTKLEDLAEDYKEGTEPYKMASRIMGQSPNPQKVAVMGVEYSSGSSGSSDATKLTKALNDTDGEFYFLTCESQEEKAVKALAEWTESQQKMYGVSTDDKKLAKSLDEKGYERTFYVLHNDPKSYPAEGYIGRCAPEDPGSITWNFKTVSGIVPSGIKPDEKSNANIYIEQHGEQHMYDGRTSSSEWIDVIRSQDFLYTRIDESVFGTLLRAKKVPFTNTGISMITSAIETPIKVAARNGMVATDEGGEYMYSVTAPNRSEVPTNDRANRVLPDITAEVTLAGAIHGGKISLVIKV